MIPSTSFPLRSGRFSGALGGGLMALVFVIASACAPEAGPTGPTVGPSLSTGDGGAGELILCKYVDPADGPVTEPFDFAVSADGGVVAGDGTFSVFARSELTTGPECVSIWTPNGSAGATVTITESPPPGWEPYAVFYDALGFMELVGNTAQIPAGSYGGVVFFKNRPIDMAPGRMTGGGGQVRLGTVTLDGRVTRGFTIHCDITLSNNVEINWPDNRWHIDKPLTSALCIDDPAIHPEPPPAPFDTFIGEGIGRLNGVDGSILRFVFVDAGEPGGKSDRATINVWAPGDDPDVDDPVLSVDGFLDHGNLQAHFDQPHGNRGP